MRSFFLLNCRTVNARWHSIVSVVLLTILPLLAQATVPGPITGTLAVCVGKVNTLGNAIGGGTWTSGNTSIATINSTSGKVTGISAGTAMISYSTGDGLATTIVTVYPLPAPITGASALCTGSTITLSSTTSGGTWSNYGVATIATVGAFSGIVTGAGAGVASITYTAGGCSVTKKVTVHAAISTGTFSILNDDRIITTIAGNGSPAYSAGDGGMATNAQLYWPSDMLVDPLGNIYIAEVGRIRKIDTAGIITTIAGTGESVYSSGSLPATDATIMSPMHIAMDATGNLYIAEYYNDLRKIDTSGMISTIAEPYHASGIVIDPLGYINVSQEFNYNISRIDVDGVLKLIAGTGLPGSNGDGIPATDASLHRPADLLTDQAGNIYFSSTFGHQVSRIDSAGIIHSFAGNGTDDVAVDGTAATSTGLDRPKGMVMDAAGNFYLADGGQSKVLKVDPSGIISTFAGRSDYWMDEWEWGDGGSATAAVLVPKSLAIDHNGDILILDQDFGMVRKIKRGTHVEGAFDICQGYSLTLENSVPGGTWSSSNTAVATVGTGGVVTGIVSGSAVISYTVTNSCNTAVATITVNVSAPGAITGTAALCSGTTTTLSHAVAGGIWSSSNTSVATIGSATGEVNGVAAGTATISYSLTTGCGASYTTEVVTVNSLPDAGTITGTATVCQGASVTLANAVSGGIWSSSNTAIATVSTSGTVTGVTSGTATISYTVTNSCGTAYTTAVVTVNAVPSIPAITGTFTTCPSATTTLANTLGGGNWSSSNTSVATVGSANGIVTGVASGTATISYAVTNGCGTAYSFATITVNALPDAGSITGPSTVCTGGTITLTSSATSGSWSSSLSAVASVGATTGIVDGIFSYPAVTISYTLSNSCGSASATHDITVLGEPVIGAIYGSTNICGYGTTTLSNGTSGGTWTSSNTGVAVIGSATGIVSAVGAGTSRITYTTSNSCHSSTVSALVAVSGIISGSTEICVGSASTLSASTVPATIGMAYAGGKIFYIDGTGSSGYVMTDSIEPEPDYYQWGCAYTSLPGASGTAIGTGIANTHALVTGCTETLSEPTAATIFASLVLNGYDDWFLPSIDELNQVYINRDILGGFREGYYISSSQYDNLYVYAQSLLFGDIQNHEPKNYHNRILAARPFTYVAGGTWGSSNTAVATVDPVTGVVTGVATGTAVISYTSGSCSNSVIVSVNPAGSAGTITGTGTVCAGNTTALSNTVTGGAWSSGNTSVATIGTAGVVTGIAAGTATISYGVTTGCGTSYATMIVTINPLPSAGSITGTATVCPGATTTLANAVTGGVWTSSNTSVATAGSGSGVVTGIAPGTATISYSVTNSCGTTFATTIVTVNAAPSVPAITGTLTTCVSATSTLANALSGGNWSSSNTSVVTVGSGSGIVTGVSAGNTAISYTVTNSCGTAMASAIVTVNAVPNAGTITGASSLTVGASTTLTTPVSGGVWSVSNTNATVSAGGVVTGVNPGSTVVSYTVTNSCGAAVATKIITISSAAIGSITGSLAVCQGLTTALSNAAAGGIWAVSNYAVATINASTGVLTGVGAGTATVVYSYAGYTTSAIVTVNPLPAAISGPTSVCTNASVTLTDATTGGTWSSSSPALGTVSATGVVTGIAAGTPVISYILGTGCYRAVNVTVKGLPGGISGNAGLCIGSTSTLTAGTGTSWSSSTPAVATVGVLSGVVTGVSAGTSTITFNASTGCIATKVVTVAATPAIAAITGPSGVLIGGTITLSDATPGGVWSSNSTARATVSAGGVVTGVSAPAATISYTVTNDVCVKSVTKLITVTSHRPGGNEGFAVIRVFPNPTTGQFTVESPVSGTFTVYTMDGKLVQQMDVAAGTNAFNLRHELAAGVYVCRFNGDDGSSTMVRLVYE